MGQITIYKVGFLASGRTFWSCWSSLFKWVLCSTPLGAFGVDSRGRSALLVASLFGSDSQYSIGRMPGQQAGFSRTGNLFLWDAVSGAGRRRLAGDDIAVNVGGALIPILMSIYSACQEWPVGGWVFRHGLRLARIYHLRNLSPAGDRFADSVPAICHGDLWALVLSHHTPQSLTTSAAALAP